MAKRLSSAHHAVQFEYRFDRFRSKNWSKPTNFSFPKYARPLASTELNSAQEIAHEPSRCRENHTIESRRQPWWTTPRLTGTPCRRNGIFQDEGYSGASLVRPGLEALRDLAAQGQITTVLIYSPARLSRKYAYQVLLGEDVGLRSFI